MTPVQIVKLAIGHDPRLCRSLGCTSEPPSTLENCFTCNQFLRHYACSGEHSQTAVVEFLVLHLFQLLRICWLRPERVEAKVSCTFQSEAASVEQGWPLNETSENPKCRPEIFHR